jgi:hypothetical protein
VESLRELFALPRYAGTFAVLLRCKDIADGKNNAWVKENRTGIWSFKAKERLVQTVIVLLNSEKRGDVEVYAGKFTNWIPDKMKPEKGFFHVDYFELIGVTRKIGLRAFCAPYCNGPQPGPVYLHRGDVSL